MQYPQDAEPGAVEDHRFFPEWAERPPAAGSLHEVDRNSYLAGRYAEEFGHRARSAPDARAVSASIEAEGEWRVQNGCVHPGYPECARPVERGSLETRGEAVSVDWRSPRPAELSRAGLTLFRVILVGRGSERKLRSGMWSPWRKLQIRRTRLLLG
jgi:hypothetical protein